MNSRICLVSGGTGGLGRSVVHALLQRGDEVHVPWLDRAEAEQLREEVGSSQQLVLQQGDVTDAAWLESYALSLADRGAVHALLNLVGGFDMSPIEVTTPESWDRMQRLNARSAFLCCRTFTPLLRSSGSGAIVNITSAAVGPGRGAGMAAYAASKGAVVALTQALAAELRADAVTVNAIAPTTIDTPTNRSAMPDADRSGWITPAELADLCVYLTGPSARRITGNVIVAGL